MPARNSHPAEIIEVINSDGWCIRIPTLEEDVELYSFFQRELSQREQAVFGADQAWRIFDSWEEMENDHRQYNIEAAALEALGNFRPQLMLLEDVAAA